ncbi:hypothetical protein SY83_01060 [Paenibacillus swuensis]|uniref:Fungal lipase-type domain-containing protein n=2 Tax=Paenibacillus swuensis TaxID=1178515 RepID=A0A172TNJ7_9BACL|nr:hypothetical protein SY83_01060 [Paenibacillus swuensis]
MLKGPAARRAILFAGLCEQAYTQYKRGGNYVLAGGYKQVGVFRGTLLDSKKELYGFVLESANEFVIAFRGTDSAEDWVSDSMAGQVPFRFVRNGGKTHSGFTALYASMRQDILRTLRGLPSGKPLYITGHSLGGALATLCAVDVAVHSKFSRPRIYTFGSPRVGNDAFAAKFNRLIRVSRRIANTQDIVPSLPPRVYRSAQTRQVFQYAHVKGEVPISFRKGGIAANHALRNYFAAIRLKSPAYADALCNKNPGFCP